ncbi:hypothetical protein SCHPADRAFT_66176 [Schizopora paradoxa]|uniref:F-box domain-containing protein n=1 Tax=Schizopora paradoxa TaxID=27342 RepID=A0A0H2S6G9_9AGAM|nr:hypothetical protein SCHPADRAFT_66176 [Schizopora paradoxa]
MTRPQRAAKSRALKNVLAPSDVEMDFEELDDALSEGAPEGSDSDSGGSLYGDRSARRKRKGKKVGGDRTRKRARLSPSDEVRDEGVLSSKTDEKKPNRLLRLVTGPKSRAAQAKEKKRCSGSKRCLGKLKRLLDAPLDILCDILSHLEPLDLLNLARSSWALHEAIVSRQMKGVWQASLTAHSVPTLPKEVPINEVQLAYMLFDNHCQACGAVALNRGFHDQLLVRLCRGCLQYNTSSGSRIASAYDKGLAKDKAIFGFLPSKRNKYLNPDFQDVIEKYIATPPNSDERQKFIEKRKSVTVAVSQLARELHAWRHDKHRAEVIDNMSAMEDRQESIRKKLYDLGYSEEEYEFCLEIGHRGSRTIESMMWQPRRLTDKIHLEGSSGIYGGI